MRRGIGVVIALALALSAHIIAQSAPLPVDADTLVLYAGNAPVRIGPAFDLLADTSAAGGRALRNIERGGPKLTSATAQPASYVEMSFPAQAGRAYHVWIRGRATANYWGNDSIYMQFGGSVTSTGVPKWRIGTTTATWFSLEDFAGQGNFNWMWNDNGYGQTVTGEDVWFATTGTQTLRLQQREDGIIIDQIVVSPTMFYSQRPGLPKGDSTIYIESANPNPPPPPPPNPAICGSDPTAGGLRLAWDTSAGATGYRVQYGTSTGQLVLTQDVGNVSEWPIPRRPDWYLAVRAYNSNGQSALSPQVNTGAYP